MYIETLVLVNIHIYIGENKRQTLKRALLMIRHQLLVVFLHCSPTSSPFFLSDFISWPHPAAGLLLSDYTTPHRPGPPSISFLVLSPLSPVFCPHGDRYSLHTVISGPHLLLFLLLFPAPKTPDPSTAKSFHPQKV